MTPSIFWYDFETTGTSPRCDRPLQVAGIRTSETLEEIGEPLNIYCRPSDDILPHPAACLITGITPAMLASRGLCEAEFTARLHAELSRPGTCGAGYNSLRFDDEVTRYTLYRNFYDPYAREWQNGNSRWDIIDLVRAAYALRPDGLTWPTDEQGRVTLKLERLSAANGLEHLQAHDALSDVRATIGVARLIRDRQPRLYDYLYGLRRKAAVLEQVRLLEPLVHVSGRFGAERRYLSVALPLAWHPRNRNALIVCDLQADCSPLLDQSADTLRERLYTRRDALPAGAVPVPLKLLHVNRCPVIAPLGVLRPADIARIGVDLDACRAKADELVRAQDNWGGKLAGIYREERFDGCEDPEQQLYDGFLGDRDRRLCDQVRNLGPNDCTSLPFDDPRLAELLFRYRARNFAGSLTESEQQRWQEFCRQRLSDPVWGAPITLAGFEQAVAEQLPGATAEQAALLGEWRRYAQGLRERYNLFG